MDSQNIKINLPFGSISFNNNSDKKVDTGALENINWENAFEKAQKDSNGKTSIDSLIDNALEGTPTDEMREVLNKALESVNGGEKYFNDWKDFETFGDEGEKEHFESVSNEFTLTLNNSETLQTTGIKNFSPLSERIGDKLQHDKTTGDNYINVDKWSSTKKDNLDCISRIIYNSYGVSLYSDDGQKIYKEFARVNNFDENCDNVMLLAGQKVILPTVGVEQKEESSKETKEEAEEVKNQEEGGKEETTQQSWYLSNIQQMLVKPTTKLENEQPTITSDAQAIAYTYPQSSTVEVYGTDAKIKEMSFPVAIDKNAQYFAFSQDANGAAIGNDNVKLYFDDNEKLSKAEYYSGTQLLQTREYKLDENGKFLQSTTTAEKPMKAMSYDNCYFSKIIITQDKNNKETTTAYDSTGQVYKYNHEELKWEKANSAEGCS